MDNAPWGYEELKTLATKVLVDLLPLTDAERAELAARPIGAGFRALTDEQFAQRLSVAKKYVVLELAEPDTPEWAKAVYETTPKWGFYIVPGPDGNGRCRRVYGAASVEGDDRGHVWVITAMYQRASRPTATGEQNEVVAAVNRMTTPVPQDDVQRVARWRAADLELFATLRASEHSLFIDPLSFFFVGLATALLPPSGQCQNCGRCSHCGQ